MTPSEKQAIGFRFKTFRIDYAQIDQTDLASDAGLNQKTISFIETGRTLPNQKVLTYLAKKYKGNSEWIMTGKGLPVSGEKEDNNSIANMQARIASLESMVNSLQETIQIILKKLE